jgi:transketolase
MNSSVGHEFEPLRNPFLWKSDDRPLCVNMTTIKGKGVSFMEGKAEWHNKMPTPEQELVAQIDLGIGVG